MGEHERLQGAYAHVQRLRSEIRLSTIGFFKSDCWFEETKPVAKPVINLPSANDSSSTSGHTDPLKHLETDHSGWSRSHITQLNSISGAPADEEANRRSTSVEIVVALVVMTLLLCCVCGYFILKNRGSCFRKPSDQERGSNLEGDSRRGTGIEMEASAIGQDCESPDVSARV